VAAGPDALRTRTDLYDLLVDVAARAAEPAPHAKEVCLPRLAGRRASVVLARARPAGPWIVNAGRAVNCGVREGIALSPRLMFRRTPHFR
jgi:hypothetical protein